ncbi:MAG: PKD domain-containing protein, partial [Dehalococcoidia bacterium]
PIALVMVLIAGMAGSRPGATVTAQQNPCILIFPPPPGCSPQIPGRITVNAGGPYNGRVGQPVILRATVASPLPPGTSFQFQWSFGDGTSGFGQATSHVYTTPGTYTVTVTVFGGGQTASAGTTATVTQPTQPLQVSAGGPYTGQVNTLVQFISRVSGAAPGSTTFYRWSFGDGNFGSGANPTHVYSAPGTFGVSLQVTTTAGQSGFSSTTAQISRQAVPLVVNAGGPYAGTAGSSVTFFGTVTGAVSPQFQWTFGDGTVGSGQNVAHTYVSAGTFSVTLTVTDIATGQSAQSTTTAAIQPPAAPAPPPPPPAPQPRAFASMAYHPPTNRVVLFGGLICQGSHCTDQQDTWTWDGSTWTQQSPANAPSSRYGASIAYHPSSQRLILFGGVDCNGPDCVDSSDTWAWDGSTWTQLFPQTSPAERSDASLVYDADRSVLVLFGGQDTGGAILNDTWIWNGTNWVEQGPATSPTARFGAGMAFDVARGVTVLFGGSDSSASNLGDTWTWDGSTWTLQNPATSPTPRGLGGMVYDSSRNVTVLFGGVTNGNQALGDTWIWNGSTWSQQSPATSPSPRYGSGIAFNTTSNLTVLFSGTNGAADTWVWNGSAWQQR